MFLVGDIVGIYGTHQEITTPERDSFTHKNKARSMSHGRVPRSAYLFMKVEGKKMNAMKW
jgi:hypothetical protein